MRRTFALVLMLLLPVLLVADEKKPDAKPHPLTPKEASDGWLLLFDGETTFGWTIDGEAKVENGVLVLGGKKPTRASVSTVFGEHEIDLSAEAVGKEFVEVYPGAQNKNARMQIKVKAPRTRTLPHAPLDITIPANTEVRIHRARLRPLAMKPIFNGTDLDGWKVFEGKGKKSKYTVTKEGWLNVKDGPGDLQTKKLHDDFVLQLECISNGKRLNSGIFFRCIADQYQNGYEAQIHNGFTDKPEKTYTIDEYDPETHKLLGKKKIQSTAVDYGTGAIYRRIPARRGVAKDGEWFTMTVVARGRRIATWVNGVQMVDWTDNRPDNDNPRQGYRAAAGAISIQGHDPTTDLSFRNLRLAELPRMK
jgi:hypothetical protein